MLKKPTVDASSSSYPRRQCGNVSCDKCVNHWTTENSWAKGWSNPMTNFCHYCIVSYVYHGWWPSVLSASSWNQNSSPCPWGQHHMHKSCICLAFATFPGKLLPFSRSYKVSPCLFPFRNSLNEVIKLSLPLHSPVQIVSIHFWVCETGRSIFVAAHRLFFIMPGFFFLSFFIVFGFSEHI